MNSKEILKQIVEQPFNKEKFSQFIADFLNDYRPKQFSLISFYPSFSDYINKFNLLGEYQDPRARKIHILEVELKDAHKLEYARTAQRNLIAKYLEDNWLDGALVGFWAPDSPRWRFSFVKLTWEFDKENKKTKKILSPAKRYSFLIGEGEPSHTAQSQLLPILEQEDKSTLEQIEEAFSVEKVTKEFYQEIANWYFWTMDEVEFPDDEDKDRKIRNAKNLIRLITRIIFVWFMTSYLLITLNWKHFYSKSD